MILTSSLSRQKCFLGFRNLFLFSGGFNKTQSTFKFTLEHIYLSGVPVEGLHMTELGPEVCKNILPGDPVRLNLFLGLGVFCDFLNHG